MVIFSILNPGAVGAAATIFSENLALSGYSNVKQGKYFCEKLLPLAPAAQNYPDYSPEVNFKMTIVT
jgi:hypothetical protein